MKPRNYVSDLTDKQWNRIKTLLPSPSDIGRPRTTSMRDVIDALLYMNRTGCQWALLPSEFPPRSTVYGYFAAWRDDGVWDDINRTLREEVRVQSGRQPTPSAAIIDSQTTKNAHVCDNTGYDGAKKTKGRKRHIAVDVMGWLLVVMVHSAGLQDRQGAKGVLALLNPRFPGLQRVWADGGYSGHKLADWLFKLCQCVLEIVKRPRKRFQIVKWRWIVERSFGWLNWQRRLSKDYEILESSAEAWVKLAFINVMLHRLEPD